MIEDCRQSRAERRPGDTRQVGGNEGIGHDVKPVYLVLKGFESRVPGHERGKQFAARRRRDGAQEPDGRQPARLLRTWRKRPRRGRDAEQRDERAPAAHSITSSARPSSVSGIVRPSAVAVIRLMTRSNLIGCSTGKLAGFAPRRILSTKSPARRNRSGTFAP